MTPTRALRVFTILLGLIHLVPWSRRRTAVVATNAPVNCLVQETGNTVLRGVLLGDLGDEEDVAAAAAAATATDTNNNRKQCSIYMAPSSLKGLVGYGIFTTRDLERQESILQAPDGPSIVVTNFRAGSGARGKADASRRLRWTDQWDNYWWGRGVGDHARWETDGATGGNMIDFQPTFGALPNHHCLWATITHKHPKVPYADHLDLIATTNGTTTGSTTNHLGPGAGAYSYHMGRDFKVKKALKAGSELFLNYGYCDREENDESTDWTHAVKMEQDYEWAANIVLSIWNALYYYEESGSIREEFELVRNDGTLATYEGQNLMDLPLVEGILYFSNIVREDPSHPVRSLIPTTTGDLFRAMDKFVPPATKLAANRSKKQKKKSRSPDPHDRFQRQQNVDLMELAEELELNLGVEARTPEWIRDNGICLENLVPQPSTIPHAGQGGFAQHFIKQGDVVVPAPLLPILHKDVLKIHHHRTNKKNDDEGEDDNEDVEEEHGEEEDKEQEEYEQHETQQQLLLNYCWGHPETTLLLCPITNALLINHCSDRPGFPCPSGSGTGPNAKIQWANNSTWDPTTAEWLQLSIKEMIQRPNYERGLSMEVIATRDIGPGEEVFVDYGVEWEQAWTKHVLEWEASSSRPSVTLLNQKIEQGLPLTHLVSSSASSLLEAVDFQDVIDSNNKEDYEYMMTTCLYEITEQDEDPVYKAKYNWRQEFVDDDEGLLLKYADDGHELFNWGGYANHDERSYWPCRVLRLDTDDEASTSDSEEEDEKDDGTMAAKSPTYTVRILPSPFHRDEYPPWQVNDLPRLLTHYPLSSIRYFPRPYHSDQHLPQAFRHPMSLPNDMLPEQWKNVDLDEADE